MREWRKGADYPQALNLSWTLKVMKRFLGDSDKFHNDVVRDPFFTCTGPHQQLLRALDGSGLNVTL